MAAVRIVCLADGLMNRRAGQGRELRYPCTPCKNVVNMRATLTFYISGDDKFFTKITTQPLD